MCLPRRHDVFQKTAAIREVVRRRPVDGQDGSFLEQLWVRDAEVVALIAAERASGLNWSSQHVTMTEMWMVRRQQQEVGLIGTEKSTT